MCLRWQCQESMLQNWGISTGKVSPNPFSLQYSGLQELLLPALSYKGTVCEGLGTWLQKRGRWTSGHFPKGQGLSQPLQ